MIVGRRNFAISVSFGRCKNYQSKIKLLLKIPQSLSLIYLNLRVDENFRGVPGGLWRHHCWNRAI